MGIGKIDVLVAAKQKNCQAQHSTAIEIVDFGSIPLPVKTNNLKLVFTAFVPEVQALKKGSIKPPLLEVQNMQLRLEIRRTGN